MTRKTNNFQTGAALHVKAYIQHKPKNNMSVEGGEEGINTTSITGSMFTVILRSYAEMLNVPMAMLIKIPVFWNVKKCRWQTVQSTAACHRQLKHFTPVKHQ
jgi:hypothetical protein